MHLPSSEEKKIELIVVMPDEWTDIIKRIGTGNKNKYKRLVGEAFPIYP